MGNGGAENEQGSLDGEAFSYLPVGCIVLLCWNVGTYDSDGVGVGMGMQGWGPVTDRKVENTPYFGSGVGVDPKAQNRI